MIEFTVEDRDFVVATASYWTPATCLLAQAAYRQGISTKKEHITAGTAISCCDSRLQDLMLKFDEAHRTYDQEKLDKIRACLPIKVQIDNETSTSFRTFCYVAKPDQERQTPQG